MHIGICAGHSVRTPGAVAGGMTEQSLCRDLADRIWRIGAERGWTVDDPRSDCMPLGYPTYLRHRIEHFNATMPDCALDLHLNACTDPATNYSLVLHGPDRDDSRRLAEALAGQFVELPWRVASPRTDEAIGRRLAFVREIACPAVVVEPLFLTSPEARVWLMRPGSADRLAHLIIGGLEDYRDATRSDFAHDDTSLPTA